MAYFLHSESATVVQMTFWWPTPSAAKVQCDLWSRNNPYPTPARQTDYQSTDANTPKSILSKCPHFHQDSSSKSKPTLHWTSQTRHSDPGLRHRDPSCSSGRFSKLCWRPPLFAGCLYSLPGWGVRWESSQLGLVLLHDGGGLGWRVCQRLEVWDRLQSRSGRRSLRLEQGNLDIL